MTPKLMQVKWFGRNLHQFNSDGWVAKPNANDKYKWHVATETFTGKNPPSLIGSYMSFYKHLK